MKTPKIHKMKVPSSFQCLIRKNQIAMISKPRYN